MTSSMWDTYLVIWQVWRVEANESLLKKVMDCKWKFSCCFGWNWFCNLELQNQTKIPSLHKFILPNPSLSLFSPPFESRNSILSLKDSGSTLVVVSTSRTWRDYDNRKASNVSFSINPILFHFSIVMHVNH